MTPNEKKLTTFFVWTLLTALFILSLFSSSLRLKSVDASESSLRASMAKLPLNGEDEKVLRVKLEEARKRVELRRTPDETLPLTDFVESIRGRLAKLGLEATKYQIVGNAGDESVEFILRGSVLSFLTFLREAEETHADFPYIVIRPISDGQQADIVFRARYGN